MARSVVSYSELRVCSSRRLGTEVEIDNAAPWCNGRTSPAIRSTLNLIAQITNSTGPSASPSNTPVDRSNADRRLAHVVAFGQFG
jgi:hypothetical protein